MSTAVSSVDICNLALSLLGTTAITSIASPSSPNEISCARWYDVTRRSVLRMLPWNFATKRAIIAANATAPEFGYENAYDLPSYYLRLLTIGDIDIDGEINTDYVIENNQILINNSANSLNIKYIFDQVAVPRFDAIFVELLSYYLAKQLAFEVTHKVTIVERLEREFQKLLAHAASIDGQEVPPRRIEQSKWLQSRRNQGIGYNNKYYNF